MTVSVYRLRDAAGVLLYVGCSERPATRIASHRRKPWGSEIATVEVDAYPDRPTAAQVEYEFMQAEQPPYNRVLRLDTRTDIDLPLHPTVVGIPEICQRLGVTRSAFDQWRYRNVGFPAAKWIIGGRPAWDWPDVEAWAKKTGRLTGDSS